jgi:hypothetical protein
MMDEILSRLSSRKDGRVTIEGCQSWLRKCSAHASHLYKPWYRGRRFHVLIVERMRGVDEDLEEDVIWQTRPFLTMQC